MFGIPGCAFKSCTGACANLIEVRFKGNHTHKPPVGSKYVLISSVDIDGNVQNQYFVYNQDQTVHTSYPSNETQVNLQHSKKADTYSKQNLNAE